MWEEREREREPKRVVERIHGAESRLRAELMMRVRRRDAARLARVRRGLRQWLRQWLRQMASPDGFVHAESATSSRRGFVRHRHALNGVPSMPL